MREQNGNLREKIDSPSSTLQVVRRLNDQLRKFGIGGKIVSTQGFQILRTLTQTRIVHLIRSFDDFDEDNDPHVEHDFGAVEFDGVSVFFKIDYFDRNCEFHSPDPANPVVTLRVMTIMLSDEY